MNIVYIPGFGSSSRSSKSLAFRDWTEGKGYTFIGIEYPLTYEYNIVLDSIKDAILGIEDDIVFVGTSFGGWWGLHLGLMFERPALVINPSIYPENSLTKHLREGTDVVPSWDGERVLRLTPEIIEEYRDKPVILGKGNPVPRVVFLCDDDDIIDPNIAFEALRGTAHIIRLPDGGHSGYKYMQDYTEELEKLIYRIGII